MAALPPERILKLVVQLTNAGNRLSFALHYYASSSLTGGIADAFITAWETACASALLDCLSQEVKINAYICTCIQKETINPGAKYVSGAPGTIAVESLPSNVSAIIQLRQLEVSSKHNGRINIPGIPEDAVVDSLITTTYVSTCLDIFRDAFMGTIVASGINFNCCVVKRDPPPLPFHLEGRLVHSANAVRNLATQRRRTTELREFHP